MTVSGGPRPSACPFNAVERTKCFIKSRRRRLGGVELPCSEFVKRMLKMMIGSKANSKHGVIIGKSARKCRNKKDVGKNRSLERRRSSSKQNHHTGLEPDLTHWIGRTHRKHHIAGIRTPLQTCPSQSHASYDRTCPGIEFRQQSSTDVTARGSPADK